MRGGSLAEECDASGFRKCFLALNERKHVFDLIKNQFVPCVYDENVCRKMTARLCDRVLSMLLMVCAIAGDVKHTTLTNQFPPLGKSRHIVHDAAQFKTINAPGAQRAQHTSFRLGFWHISVVWARVRR